MNDTSLQTQINDLNNKVDLILDYVNQQRLQADSITDLIADVSMVGKDIYDTTITELENHAVEIDPDEVKSAIIRLSKNVNNINKMLEMMESGFDFAKDAAPIANEIIIDLGKKLNEFESKGYFEFLKELGNVTDNIVTHFTKEDIRLLADNIVTIFETIKEVTQPDMLNSVNNAISIYGSIDMNNIPEYSMMKALREMRKPEMKRAIGFVVTFLKNIANTNNGVNNT